MTGRGNKLWRGAAGLVGTATMLIASAEVTLDFGADLSHTFAASGQQDWTIAGEAIYQPGDQSLVVSGTYRTRQTIEPDAFLSFRVVDDAGGILLADGVRFPWQAAPDGAWVAVFELELPPFRENPLLTDWSVEFNAVKEGEYWYRDQFPGIEFARLTFRDVPVRDHYTAKATWIPRYLPAGFPARIPAWFTVSVRDEENSGFRPALDLVESDRFTKVPSPRLELLPMAAGTFWGWMPLGRQEQSTLWLRPGMVWENVRWYDATDWFARERVDFVSPIHYLLGMALLGALWLAGWRARGRLRPRAIRYLAGGALMITALWWAGNLWISGFWPAMLALLLAWGVGGSARIPVRSSGYAFAWLFMVWVELYWGHLEGTAGILGPALMFSAATWALLLMPLLLIKSRGWGLGVSLVVTLGWWLATVVGVAYHDFFFDFPSVGDLLYAGQIGQLGDSVGTLLSARHWLPLWVWALMAGATLLGWRLSGTPKSKTQNT